MSNVIHRMPSVLCGLAALVLASGAMATGGEDRTDQPMQNSTPTAQTPQADKPMASSANRSAAAMNDRSGLTMSETAQAKFDAIDADHDGTIDKQEAQASKALSNEFSRLDSDKNNKLSLSEFMSAQNLASIKVDKNDATDKSHSKKD